jgi:hypothetical protein
MGVVATDFDFLVFFSSEGTTLVWPITKFSEILGSSQLAICFDV